MTDHIALKNISEETQKEILRKNWQSHDGRWQFEMFSELGPEKGNSINKEVARAVYRGATYRLLKAFNKNKVSSMDEFKAILSAAMELFHAHENFKYQIERITDTSLCAFITKCGTNDSVQKAGVVDLYECGCFSCRAGCYEAMGLSVEEKCVKCLTKGDDCCEIIITINPDFY